MLIKKTSLKAMLQSLSEEEIQDQIEYVVASDVEAGEVRCFPSQVGETKDLAEALRLVMRISLVKDPVTRVFLIIIACNPSTGGDHKLDTTLRRVKALSERNEWLKQFHGEITDIVVVNLSPLRGKNHGLLREREAQLDEETHVLVQEIGHDILVRVCALDNCVIMPAWGPSVFKKKNNVPISVAAGHVRAVGVLRGMASPVVSFARSGEHPLHPLGGLFGLRYADYNELELKLWKP